MTLRLVVTGGRSFADTNLLYRALDTLHSAYGVSLLIHGDASGADRMGGQWAVSQDVPVRAMPADWSDLSHPGAVIRTSRYGQYDARAGHRRNQSMLDEAAPDYAIAFPGGTGTADMVRRIIAARLPLWDLRADQA